MGRSAFVFSGQGDQFPGMGKAFFDRYEEAREMFLMFDRIRPGTSGQCFYGTAEELRDTANAQPCLFAMELAAAEVLKAHRILPDAVAGCLGDQDIFFEKVAAAGGRVIPLEVSGGFHSPLMAAASARFRRTVRQAETGTTNVYSSFLVLFMLP